MEFRLEPGRLLSDELSYELLIRGSSSGGSVSEKRARLRENLRLEKTGVQLLLDLPLSPTSELEACNKKIVELETATDAYGPDNYQNEYARIGARLSHLTNRLTRIHPGDDHQRMDLLTLTDRGTKCSAELRSKFASQTSALLHLEQERSLYEPDEPQEEELPVAASSPGIRPGLPMVDARLTAVLENLSVSLAERNREPRTPATYPLHSWNMTYDGGPGLTSFLERIDELRIARGLNKEQLFTSAVELFAGAALTWYRAKRTYLQDWDDLVDALRRSFLPTDYDEQLWMEIRQRTQGADERACVYIASMQGLFNRLSISPSEPERIKQVRRNLLPHLIHGLGLGEFHHLADLDYTCRRLEDLQSSMRAYKAPPTPAQSLEPDLAYAGAHTARTPQAPGPPRANDTPRPNTSRSPPVCWNCRRSGHRSADCREPPSLHCRRCGTADTTSSNCPRCSGNGRGRR